MSEAKARANANVPPRKENADKNTEREVPELDPPNAVQKQVCSQHPIHPTNPHPSALAPWHLMATEPLWPRAAHWVPFGVFALVELLRPCSARMLLCDS